MKWLARLLLGLAVLVAPVLAQAHDTLPARIIDVQAGPYALEVDLLADIAQAGSSYEAVVSPKAGGVRLTAELLPGPGVDATPLRGRVSPDLDRPGAFGVYFVSVTTRGDWTLVLHADGASGAGEARVPLKAVPPPAIPVWLGWAIGLTPLYGLLWFAWREYLRLEAAQRTA